MKKLNSRDRGKENKKTFTRTKGTLNAHFGFISKVILSTQCQRLGPFIIIMQKHGLK